MLIVVLPSRAGLRLACQNVVEDQNVAIKQHFLLFSYFNKTETETARNQTVQGVMNNQGYKLKFLSLRKRFFCFISLFGSLGWFTR